MEVSVRYGSIDSAVFELLALGPGVDVLTPIELRTRLREAATEIASTNAGPPPVRRR